MEMFTSFFNSPLGCIKVECSSEHLLSVSFINVDENSPINHHPILQETTLQLKAFFEGKLRTFTIPMNQNGTEFQKKVWDLLYYIPYGKTISYNELAKQYGDIKAIRAVAAANGRNNIAIIIPCHRVIGSDRSLTGYAGGLWRKKWLLDHEAKFYSGVQHLF
jgi:methylated-DNA-[protein]-cysteine S-methyltransferase